MYNINNLGLKRLSYIKRQVLQTFFLVIPFFIALIFVFHFLIISQQKSIFYTVMLPFFIIWILLSFFSTIRWLNRHSRIISKLAFLESNLVLTTSNILWIKTSIFNIPASEILIKDSIFNWIENKEKINGKYREKETKGIIVSVKENNLYLIENFFDEYSEILNKLRSEI